MLYAVVAMDPNRLIGANGTLPWHLPEDLKIFKKITMGSPIIMGRTTYESIGRPLPGRRNIVVSRSWNEAPDGIEHASSVDDALKMVADAPTAYVIGGTQLYAAMLEQCDGLFVSHVHQSYEGDTYFPEFAHLFDRAETVESYETFDLVRYQKKLK